MVPAAEVQWPSPLIPPTPDVLGCPLLRVECLLPIVPAAGIVFALLSWVHRINGTYWELSSWRGDAPTVYRRWIFNDTHEIIMSLYGRVHPSIYMHNSIKRRVLFNSGDGSPTRYIFSPPPHECLLAISLHGAEMLQPGPTDRRGLKTFRCSCLLQTWKHLTIALSITMYFGGQLLIFETGFRFHTFYLSIYNELFMIPLIRQICSEFLGIGDLKIKYTSIGFADTKTLMDCRIKSTPSGTITTTS